MNLLRLSSLFLAPALVACFALACGEISDPTKSAERTATVSGALTGTNVPAGARVAVVWRNGQSGGPVVGSEADIVGGKFTMTLSAPPDAYFYPMNGEDYDSLNGGGAPPIASGGSAPAPVEDPDTTAPSGGGTGSGGTSGGSGGTKVAQKLGTRGGTVSGGITEPLAVATAGFVVYVDGNGNGKLDLEGQYSSSPDTIIGGNKELILAYLKGGGQLDYEKLRDKSGILPVAGFNLAWDEGRWLPLSLVELQINDKVRLPSAICGSYSSFGGGEVQEETAAAMPRTSTVSDGGTPDGGYPPKGAPGVYCYDGGRSFYYTGDCPPPPPPPVGLCAPTYGAPTACASPSYSFVGDTPPPGWPCDVDDVGGGAVDAGTSVDASVPPPDSGVATDGGS